MNKPLRAKLRSRGGETLVETVVAILVVALASGLLATMILGATRLNETALVQDQAYYDQLNAAERRRDGGTEGTVTVTDAASNAVQYPVLYYGRGDGLTSYALKGGGP